MVHKNAAVYIVDWKLERWLILNKFYIFVSLYWMNVYMLRSELSNYRP